MVTVPGYSRTETLRPAFRQGIDVTASPEAFGAAQGRGLQSLAAGLGNLATSVSRVQALDDETRAKEADTNFSGWLRERQYGENGYMLTEGKNAVDGRAAFEKEVEEKRKEYGAGLSGGASRHYSDASNSRVNSSFQSAIIHSANGRKKWVSDASNARLNGFANDAMVAVGNQAAVEKNIAAGQAELRQQSELHGWDADTLKAKEQGFISGVTKNVALKMAEESPISASEYIKANANKLTGADRLSLDKTLKTPLENAEAGNDAARIMGFAPAVVDPVDAAPDKSALAVTDGKAKVDKPVATGDDGAVHPAVPGLTKSATPDRRGNYNNIKIARSLVGVEEHRDTVAISSFIKKYAGIEIDPSKTAWCAGIVNGVLGANGIEGTGKLNARSFMNFGTATNDPQPGDVVVFSRGAAGSGKGHVGFFNGYDANGGIKVLGGNQSNKFSEQTYSADRLLGFRRPPQASAGGTPAINQTVPGLQHIEDEVNKLPVNRQAAVRKEISSRITFHEKLKKKDEEAAQENVGKWMLANPKASPDDLPPPMQQKLGVDGMKTLHSWHDEVLKRGQTVTDEKVLSLLQDDYADDPEGFGQTDLFKYRDRLSKEDWTKVTGWRQTARTDMRKAREDGGKIKSAFTQSNIALEAAGIVKPSPKEVAKTDAYHKKMGQFQAALSNEIESFNRDNKRYPTAVETQTIINRLLLPVVMSSPGALFGTNTRDGRMFETGSRADNETVDVNVQYQDIPIDVRRKITADLDRSLFRKPSQQEVTTRYEQFVLGVKVVDSDPLSWMD